MAVISPGQVFEQWPAAVQPVTRWLGNQWLFPSEVALCRAVGSQPSERAMLLIHGLTQNEDYFGLVASQLVARGHDVWALRLPGYVAHGQPKGFWPTSMGLSLHWYGWVVASTITHLAHTLEPRPTQLVAWGHSMGGAALALAVANHLPEDAPLPSQLIFEAPAFGEAIHTFMGGLASATLAPEDMLRVFVRALLIDDVLCCPYATQQLGAVVPGHTSRAVFNLNLLALMSPLNRMPKLSARWLERCWFALARHDRLVDYELLTPVLDKAGVPLDRRLTLPRNHFLSLSSPGELLDWLPV